jgi:hypothetical protein
MVSRRLSVHNNGHEIVSFLYSQTTIIMTNRILLTYKHISDARLPAMALFIIECMTGNAHFPAPTPTLDHLRDTAREFQNTYVRAQTGGKQAETDKDKQSAGLRSLLHELAAYVTKEAKEDRQKLLSSGFDITKERASRYPQTIKIETGKKSGQVTSIMKSIPGAKAYIHQYTRDNPGDDTTWTQEISTSRKHVFKDLVPGARYFFRIMALGLRGKKTWSGMLDKIVQ